MPRHTLTECPMVSCWCIFFNFVAIALHAISGGASTNTFITPIKISSSDDLRRNEWPSKCEIASAWCSANRSPAFSLNNEAPAQILTTRMQIRHDAVILHAVPYHSQPKRVDSSSTHQAMSIVVRSIINRRDSFTAMIRLFPDFRQFKGRRNEAPVYAILSLASGIDIISLRRCIWNNKIETCRQYKLTMSVSKFVSKSIDEITCSPTPKWGCDSAGRLSFQNLFCHTTPVGTVTVTLNGAIGRFARHIRHRVTPWPRNSALNSGCI